MVKISRLDVEIFLTEVLLTIITCGLFPLINLMCRYVEYRDRVQERMMREAEQEGCRKRARAYEWVMLRNTVHDIEKERNGS